MSDGLNRKLVLASESPRRAEILRQASIPFEVVTPEIEEQHYPINSDNLHEDVQSLAVAKARSVTKYRHEFHVLAADTIVFLDRTVMRKPNSPSDAIEMLRRMSGQSHEVITAVAVISPEHGVHVKSEVSYVRFHKLSDDDVSDYVSTGSPLDKAGAYGIQDKFGPVESYVGCYLNVVGLPICAVGELLEKTMFTQSDRMICNRHLPVARPKATG